MRVTNKESIKRLEILRDVVLPGIPDGELEMNAYTCGTKHCLAGWAALHPPFNAAGLVLQYGEPECHLGGQFTGNEIDFFAITDGDGADEWHHIFSFSLPNDKAILAANITDLIEYRKSL